MYSENESLTHWLVLRRLVCLLPILASLLGLAACGSATTPPAADVSGSADPQVLAQLRGELRRVLAARGIELDAQGRPLKAVSSVPQRDYRLPNLTDFSPDVQLDWAYYQVGDYDQNGEVNISDLTPVGIHLGKNTGSPDWMTARVADGDANGEVNIADITPLGANFGANVHGFVVECRTNPFLPWREFGFAAFADAVPGLFGKELSYYAPGGAAEAEWRVSPVGPPRDFAWTVYELATGAAECSGPSLAVVGGVPGLAFNAQATTYGEVWYAQAGSAHPQSAAEWSGHLVDNSGSWHSVPSLAGVDGAAAMAYVVDPVAGLGYSLRYIRATTPTPGSLSDWQAHLVNDADPGWPTLRERAGLPVIAFPQLGLRLAIANTATPGAPGDWQVINAFNLSSDPQGVFLDFAAQRPLMSYVRGPWTEIGFSWSNVINPASSLDFNEYLIGPGGLYGYPALKLVGGLPRVLCNTPGNDLLYSTADNASPQQSDWGGYSVFAGTLQTGGPALAVLDGRLAVAFGAEQLQLGWANLQDPLGVSDWHLQSALAASGDRADSHGSGMLAVSVAVLDGLPLIAFTPPQPGEIMLAVASEQ